MAANLSILNDPPKVLDGPKLLHQLIQWEDYAEACAIDFTSNGHRQQYSYGEVQSCVTSLVERIQDSLAKSNTRTDKSRRQHIVPVLLPQSPGLYISQLAVLNSGGAFCPINLDAPKERVKFVVGDVSADLIITTLEFKDIATWGNGPTVIIFDEFPPIPLGKPSSRETPREASPHELSYVMYTSGSSGTPKGVAVSHLAASQSLLAHKSLIPSFCRFLQFAAPSFDVSVFEIFFPLTMGCTLVGCNRNQLLNDLPGMINQLEVDATELTPTVVGSLLQKRSNAPGLKLLLTIGEPLTRPIVEEFGGSDSKETMLYGMYGPTEAAIHCTIHPKMETGAKPGNIGVPFETVSTFIATASTGPDDAGNLKFLPIGELGELILGGPQLAQGYLNREEQNRAAFVQFEGKTYYRTGDKARQLEDGSIEIFGRISAGQVKLRGQRVELGEIEEVVYKHPGVKTVSAAVLGSNLIVFTLVGDQLLRSEDVMATCARWLPTFMVPSEIVMLRKFTYLPSGKVDKRKLISDYQKQIEDEGIDDVSSTTDSERTIKGALQEILGPFSSSMRLAAAGLDSLVAIRVASKLRLLGFNGINAVAVLQAESLTSLVQICERSTSNPSHKGALPSRGKDTKVLNGHAGDVESTMPCTPLQSAMLSETALDENAYRNWVELRLPDIMDTEQVISALKALAYSNSILRTGFAESQDSDGYIQIIWKTSSESQIMQVKEFSYEFDSTKDTSLHHPLRIQLLQTSSGIKLLLYIHHALYDAWSLELLLDDLDTLLAAKPVSERPPFSKVVDGYLDGTLNFGDWSSKEYWKDHLAHLDVRQVPNFHSRELPPKNLLVERLYSSIPTSGVEVAARRLSASPQSLFQAAYALVLGSYLGSQDICFGSVFSGRTLPIPGIEDIVGPCLATLPVRIDVSTCSTLRDLVQQLNATNRKHLEHSTLPLRDIKSVSGVNPRQLLFDTLLIWQQTLHGYDHVRKNVLLVDAVDNLEFNLTLEIIPGSGNIELKANYQNALFPTSQVKILLQQVEQLVRVILEDYSTSLEWVFNSLDAEVLSIENETPERGLKGWTLSSPVERIAAEDPDRPAIDFARSVDETQTDIHRVSYSQLNTIANQMGHHLLEKNVLPGELVCICMEKSVDLYASILAATKVGAGYLPLTPDIPPERLQHILHEGKVRLVVAKSESRGLFESLSDLLVVYVDEIDFSDFSSKNISSRSSASNISYCIFTSGSTGAPKGVLVTQGNLLSNLDVLEDLYPATESTRLLQSCSQAFDVSVFEIFFTWRVGGCLCSAVKDVVFRDIEHTIRALRITHLSLTPTVAALIDPANVPDVEFLVTAGEAVTQKVFNTWADRGLWQGYGPSETTNICTVNPRVTRFDSINNIGPPFKNTSAFVLSPGPEFCLRPRGGEGEFCFGGTQVFRGYMDRSQEVGKIIDHPKYGRLYRSGDFGRLMPNGSLAFTGRKDDQIKIRGQRVELGEINNLMLRLKEVNDCVTIIIRNQSDNSQRLYSFWTSDSENSTSLQCLPPDPSVIKTMYLKFDAALPAYMIPSGLIPVSCVPLTTQGKIDKRLLEQQFQSLGVDYLDSTFQAAISSSDHEWSDLEREIAEAAAKVINSTPNKIEPNTSFFALGIDSISAISFARILRSTIEYQVEISDILKFPSVARLAGRLSAKKLGKEAMGSVPRKVFDFGFDKRFLESTTHSFGRAGKPVQAILPCTPLQEAMLSAAESSSEKTYQNYVVMNIAGNVERLKEAWREMVRRHEILRTCFVSTNMPRYAYAQVVLKDHGLKFDNKDPDAISTEFEPPYSLNLTNANGALQLLISMHHALYDGVALAILYEEVERYYHRQDLPAPGSFSLFLKAVVSINMQESDDFWDATLKDCVPTKLEKTKQLLSPAQSQNCTRLHHMNAKTPLSWIEKKTKEHSTTLLAVCHSVWAALLSQRVQESDICFGSVVSGRTVPVKGIERLVAPCFNTIPARLPNIQKLSYLESFRTLQTLSADSLPFQLTPLRRIQSKASPDGSRLFDTLLILQQSPGDLDSSIWSISADDGAMDFPLVCEVIPKHSDDTLELVLHYYSSVISDNDAWEFLQTFDAKLRYALENPRRPLLTAAVKDQIIAKKDREREHLSQAPRDGQSSKPMSAKEEKLRDVISAFTDIPVEKIGRDVTIFRLGLDSISTVQVATRLRKQGYNILTSDILEHPTIAQLSTYLSQKGVALAEVAAYDFHTFDGKHREAVCSKNDLKPKHIEAVLPCTAVQKGMLAQALHSDGQQYVNSMSFELQQHISISQLKQAWKIVCEKHEMLRTGFSSTDDPQHPFVMIIYSKKNFSLPWFESDGDWRQSSISEQLLKRPWNVTLSREGTSDVIKFTAHHALYDAQSIQMILSDLATAYISETITTRPPITSLLGSILLSSKEDFEDKRAFWQREENKIVVNRFPDLTPLRVTDGTNTSSVRELSSRSSVAQLGESCRQNGVTMQATAQAAWARLLTGYIGEMSTTFGMPLSGRSVYEGADNISFPSIVTLPVRCDVTGTNAELLSRTMNSNALLHKHQFTPLTEIQKWAGFPEGKIFDTLCAYQKLPYNDEVANLPWKLIREKASVDYAVSLEVQPTKSGDLVLRLTFREDLIPVEHAELLLRQYDALLLDTLQNPQGSCDVAPSIGDELLSITKAKESVLPSPVTLLHEFVERGAEQQPDKKALEFAISLEPGSFQSRSWTYSQLNQESNKVAQLLLQQRVVPGQIIAICFDKCAEASFAIIGILKAGCAYVALDPNAPADRLKFIVQDSGAKLILTAGKLGHSLNDILAEGVVSLDSPNILKGYSSKKLSLSRNIKPEDIAYCLYTSGTTGTPKGCLITHDNVVQFLLAFQQLFAGHWTEDSKYLQFASFHFDVSVMEQFFSWSIGICMASAPRDLIFQDITVAIQQLAITHLDLTPSLARLLHPNDVPTLCKGAFITGGEQLKQEILDVWGEHAVIYNGYGPTEATIGCTMYPRVPKNGKPANIGPAYVNVGSFVLKPGAELPVLRGGVGELCVSGKLVGKGYLNRPDLTAEKFPTLKVFNERVYRTGDLVRILHDGSFIFLGRADDQVKLRGQRLELSEINEVVKKSIDDLDQVVTLVLKHDTQQKEQLVCFFVTTSSSDKKEKSSLISTMKDACKSRLPGYMIPTHFIPIKALPLNANNKADAKQLAAMYNKLSVGDLQNLSHSNQQYKHWNENELEILDIIAKALNIDLLSLNHSTNIFELGLDSISIIGFSRTLQNAGLGNAKISVVKSNASLEGLVKALLNSNSPDQARENAYVEAKQILAAFAQKHVVGVCKDLGVESAGVESIYPCTPMQEGMIYKFLESDQALYFNKFQFHLTDTVDTKKLFNAWNLVVERLEVLRTKFVETDDGFAQVVMRTGNFSWDKPALEYISVEKSAALRTPYTLSLESNSSRNRIILQIFHGLYDGNSLTMLLQRVVGEYRELDTVEYGPSFRASLPYGPLAVVPGAREFWTSHLGQWKYRPMSTITEASKDVVVTKVIDDLAALEIFRKQLGVTPQAVIQVAWLSVMQALISPNLTVGMVTSGRAIDFEGSDEVIGPLFNTVPFHVKIESGTTALSLISKCHEFNMKIQDFQHTHLKDIQKWSPARPGQPLFDTLFVFQRPGVEDENFADGIWTEVDGWQTADYPLAFEASLGPDSSKLLMTIVAQGSVITQSGASELLEQVEYMLHNILLRNGQNVVLEHEAGTENEHATNEEYRDKEPANTTSNRTNGVFAWTEEAQNIKEEVASLAKVTQDAIHESSSIFELGLDSIDVIKLSSRLKKRGIKIPVSVIIKCQTIAKMATSIPTKDIGPQTSPGNFLLQMQQELTKYLKVKEKFPRGTETVLPATPLQQSMVLEMINSGYSRYFNVNGFKIGENVDMKRLRNAIKTMIAQTPVLRATFVEVEDPKLPVSYAQIIHNELIGKGKLFWTYYLAQRQSFQSFMETFKEYATGRAAKDQALLQVYEVVGNGEHYLVIAISHALYDGTSLRAFHHDIQRAYQGKLAPRPDFLPFLEQVFLSTTVEAKKFWRTTLSNLPSGTFPIKELTGSEEPETSWRLERRSRVSFKDVEALCKSFRITLQTIGQTCWALVLSHLMGQLDVVFGTVLSCRDSEEAVEVAFPLMNTVAVRAVVHGSICEMLKAMQDISDASRQYQHFPLGKAQAYALASRHNQASSTNTTLFDTLFIYQGRRSAAEVEPLYESVYGSADVEFPVCVEMEIVQDEYLSWTTACKSTARNAQETEDVIEALEKVLKRIVYSSNDQAFVSDAHGISVGGLPKFKGGLDKQTKTTQTRPSNDFDNEWSSIESILRKALHELSDVPEDMIRKESTIFHLGLDSILVLKLPALLKAHGIQLSVSDIFRDQTISSMAKTASESREDAKFSLDVESILQNATVSIDLSSELEIFQNEISKIQYVIPVTAGQLYMIRQWQASKGAMFYPTFTYSFPGPVNKIKLDSAWKTLLERHDIFRTGFLEVGPNIVQVVFKNPQNDVIYHTKEQLSTTRKHILDLRAPPLNLVVGEPKGSSVVVKLVLHHALYDGISLSILIDELQSLYQGMNLGASSLVFKDFIAQSIFSSTDPHISLKWSSYVKGSTLYPAKPMNRTLTSHTQMRTEVFHPSIKVVSLKRVAQEIGVSIDALLLAALSKIYAQSLEAHYSRTFPHVTFGIYLANRAPFGEDLSLLAAPTLNLLPLCVKAPLQTVVEQVAKEIQYDISKIGSREMVGASLEKICECTGTRINFMVNILKSENSVLKMKKEDEWEPVQDLGKRAEVVEQEDTNVDIPVDDEKRFGAYLPTVDIELRYDVETGRLDMGVFAPSEMMGVEEAESLIERLVEALS